MRQRMEQHRANPACAVCHARMDPLGFALENFDAIGRMANHQRRPAIAVDASGVLPDGTKFHGPAELRKILLSHPEQFATTVTEKLLTYALGRGVEYYDQPAIRKIIAGSRFQRLPLVVTDSGNRQEHAVSDAHEQATGTRCRQDRAISKSNREGVEAMIITKKRLPRRTFLRGMGVTVGLPLLDGMIPALATAADAVAKPVTRMSFIYVPNGIMNLDQVDAGDGGCAFEMTPILEPLTPFRDHLLVLSGLSHPEGHPQPGEGGGDHARASTSFLTGVHAKQSEGADLQAGISLDQIAAKELGKHTQLASLELSLDSTDDDRRMRNRV